MHSDVFRKIMGNFPTGVTVVTTAVDGHFHGITVNSFTSVSLEPPLVLICIDRRTVAHGQIERASRFGVSFLDASQERTSRLFASSRPPEAGHLRGMAHRMGPHGSPILEGCLAWLECSVADRFAGGDHTIFLASVLAGNVEHGGDPLVFFRGRYRQLADEP